MRFIKGAALAAALGLAASTTQAADNLASYGADERPVMLSYSLPLQGSGDVKETFALSVAGNMRTTINTAFEMDSLTLNGLNVADVSNRLYADGDDDGYLPLVAIGVVVGAAFLVANQGDDANNAKKEPECQEPLVPKGGGCGHPDGGF
ncbi:MAG: hypothetical protein ACPG1C_09640 [Alphaproteobacteria bacterium]